MKSLLPAKLQLGIMFGLRVLRVSGLTWCQLKAVFRWNATMHSCQKMKEPISFTQFYCTQTSSDDNYTLTTSSASSALNAPPVHMQSAASSELSTPPVHEQTEEPTEKGIGRFEKEQYMKMLLKPDQPLDAKVLRVAIIGLPNCGKSTLTNSLLGWRVSSVSKKVHTTRKNTVGICTQDSTQIVFLDTPGILHPASRKKHNLEKTMVIDPERSIHKADLVCVLVDVSNKWTKNELDPLILQVLHLHQDKPAVLIMNKVDLLRSKAMLLQMTRTLTEGLVDNQPVGIITHKTTDQLKNLDLNVLFDAMKTHRQSQKENSDVSGQYQEDSSETQESCPPKMESLESTPSSEVEAWTAYFQKMRHASRAVGGKKGWPHFKRVFMVSAFSGDGVSDIKDYLLQTAKPGNWDYHSSLVTAQNPKEVVLMCIKEKLLEHLKEEIPYNIIMDIVLWEVDEDGMFNVIVNLCTNSRRQMTWLLGPKGQTIQKIAIEAKQEMMNAFHCEMRLKLVAKMWTKSRR